MKQRTDSYQFHLRTLFSPSPPLVQPTHLPPYPSHFPAKKPCNNGPDQVKLHIRTGLSHTSTSQPRGQHLLQPSPTLPQHQSGPFMLIRTLTHFERFCLYSESQLGFKTKLDPIHLHCTDTNTLRHFSQKKESQACL